MAWQCFLIEPTDRVRRALRRYTSSANGWTCADGWHQASVQIEDGPALISERHTVRTDPMEWPHDDPRWPTRCEQCDYAFTDEDAWQLFYDLIYRRPETGEEYTIRDAPIGAMFYSDWHLTPQTTGPDGHSLSVITPGGQWDIDWPSASGGKWTRTGTAPLVTASPSIHVIGKYHAFLQNGVLTDDLEGRTYG